MNSRKLARASLLFALSLVLSYLESLLPALPFFPPGVKLGLSNVVVMFCLYMSTPFYSLVIVFLKALFVFLLRGYIAGLLSLLGGMVSLGAMLLVFLLSQKKASLLLVSMTGAVFHNLGQLFGIYFLFSQNLIYYLPLLILSGMLMGFVTGIVLKLTLPKLLTLFPSTREDTSL